MAKKKKGLQKNVIAIFDDASPPRDLIDIGREVDEPTREAGAKATSKRRRRKKANGKASAATAVARPPEEKEPSSLQAVTIEKLREGQDAGVKTQTAGRASKQDKTQEKKPTSVESRVEESPVEESSKDVELPSDTTVETDDKSPAPTKEAEAEETGTCDQNENAAQVTTMPPRNTPKELPPRGSIGFLGRVKKAMHGCARFFTGAP